MALMEKSRPDSGRRELREEVWQRRVERLRRRMWRRRFLNLFLVWHLCAVALWLLPYPWPLVQFFIPPDGRGPVRTYLTSTNLAQSWQMFSPNPDNNDLYMTAEITFADGSTRTWEFPRLIRMGYVERYQQERYRKLFEVGDRDPRVWPALARLAVRHNAHDPRNLPVAVNVTEHSRRIPPPGMPIPPYQARTFYKLILTPEDLR